jgi:argininosuccinate lyase
MKGLPSGYNRDFHEDKEILVDVLDLMNKCLPIVPNLVISTTLNLERMEELTYGSFSTATEGILI